MLHSSQMILFNGNLALPSFVSGFKGNVEVSPRWPCLINDHLHDGDYDDDDPDHNHLMKMVIKLLLFD